jgi:predicted dienelactone hydrolase
VYTSRLSGVPLLPDRWDPLSWSVASQVARDDVAIDSHGPFPVVVFSHGSTNSPIDYAFTLEHVASHGYVVVGPWHTGNTQDDVRVDFINTQAGFRLLQCSDELPPPCSDASAAKSIADRVRDVSAVLDALPALLGNDVDVTRVAVMGHSRGTLTALAAAGGSAPFKIPAEPRVKAVLGFAIGVPGLTFSLDLARVTVPTLLVAGERDRGTPKEISEAAFGLISSADKGFVVIAGAEHRSFDSTMCAQMQSAGAIAAFNPRAILDFDTLTGWLIRNPNNGTTLDICAHDAFVNPVDITGLVASLTDFVVTADNVPRAGVDSNEVHRLMSELAVSFLDAVLDDRDDNGIHFTRFLSPKFLLKKEPNILRADFVGAENASCPPGHGPECDD